MTTCKLIRSKANSYAKKQFLMFCNMMGIGALVAALALSADWLCSELGLSDSGKTLRTEALLDFANPMLAIWLAITGFLMLGMEVFTLRRSWLRAKRKLLFESYIFVWGWFCGIAAVIYLVGLWTSQIPSQQAIISLLVFGGSTLVLLAFDSALYSLSLADQDTDNSTSSVETKRRVVLALRILALLGALGLILCYPWYSS